MLAQLSRRRMHERVPARVDLRPLCGGVLQEGLSVRVAARAEPCVRGVLRGDAEDVVHKRAGRVEARLFRNTEGVQQATDALVEVQQRGPPRLAGEFRLELFDGGVEVLRRPGVVDEVGWSIIAPSMACSAGMSPTSGSAGSGSAGSGCGVGSPGECFSGSCRCVSARGVLCARWV